MSDYYKTLVGRIHKILPLFEINKEDAKKYCKKLQMELASDDNVEIIKICKTIDSMSKYDYDIEDIKSSVLSLVPKVKKIALQEDLVHGDKKK